MKKVLGFIAGLAFVLFGIAMLGLLVSITYAALGRIFPNNPELQMWGLVLFDLSAIAWFLAFLFMSHGLVQYGAAGAGFLIGIVGTIGMAGAEVMLGSATTENPQEIARWMNYIFIFATAAHVLLLYLHHFGIPAVTQQVSTGIAKGEIKDHAMKEAARQLEHEKAQLAQSITADIMQDVQRELGLLPIDNTIFDRRRNELTTTPPPVLQPQTVAHPEHILWNRGSDPATYYEPGSEFALPCGHTAGQSWSKVKKSWVCNICDEPCNDLPDPKPQQTTDAGLWDQVKDKLENVKRDILRARDMLQADTTTQTEDPGEMPSPFHKSDPD